MSTFLLIILHRHNNFLGSIFCLLAWKVKSYCHC